MNDARTAAVTANRVHTLTTGKRIELARLGLGDFEQCKQQCLKNYKRQRIATWTDNADFIPDDQRTDWIRDAMMRAEEITLEDLPQRETTVPVRGSDGRYKVDPDTGLMKTEKTLVNYEIWWTSDTPEGQLYCAWLSMRRCKGQESYTLDDADVIFRDAQEDLEQAAQIVGELSESQLAKKAEAVEERSPPATTGHY